MKKYIFAIIIALVSLTAYPNVYRIWINEADYDYFGFRRVQVELADGTQRMWSENGFVDVDTPKDTVEMIVNGEYHYIYSDTVIHTTIKCQ